MSMAGVGPSTSSPSAAAPTSSSASTSSTSSLTGPQVWLLKLPTFVAEQFKRVQQQQAQALASSSASSNTPKEITLGSLEVSYNKEGQQQVRNCCALLTVSASPSPALRPWLTGGVLWCAVFCSAVVVPPASFRLVAVSLHSV